MKSQDQHIDACECMACQNKPYTYPKPKTNGELLEELRASKNRQFPWWMSEEILELNSAQDFLTWHDTPFTGVQSLWDYALTLPECDDEKIIADSAMAYKFINVFETIIGRRTA